MALFLKIKTEWSAHSLELKPGESIIVGRSPEANIQIPRPSVSQQHLKITFDGTEVLFEDLKSSNGTFRMPQDSPFLEARFPARNQSLQLKISKSIVDFSWQLREVTSTMAIDPTRTEVAPDGNALSPRDQVTEFLPEAHVELTPPKTAPTPVAKAEAPVVQKKSKPAPEAPAPSPERRSEPRSGPGLETKLNEMLSRSNPVDEKQAAASSAWIAFSLFSFCAFLASYIAGRLLLQGIAEAHGAQLRNGGMLDVLIIWGGFLVNQPLLSAIAALVAIFVFVSILKSFRAGRWGFVRALTQKLQNSGWAPLWPPRLIALIFVFLFFTWPIVWASIYKTPPNKTLDALQFWSVVNRRASTPAERVQQLRTLLPKLQGSSLLYKEMYGIQRQRILEECKGVGAEAPWDSKKVCLVLLTAVAIESLEEVQPGLLGDVAARAAILLSLDGISRVISVEGIQAPTIPFFLNSLDAVGLGPEREDIEKLIARPGATQEEVLGSLLDLRKRIELRLEARQIEMKLPRIFVMSFPSPLESGI